MPLAIVCALSPWAIVAVILMLASDRPSNAVAWLAGWSVSTFGIAAIIVLFLAGFDFLEPGSGLAFTQLLANFRSRMSLRLNVE